jgi:hypothetical protein
MNDTSEQREFAYEPPSLTVLGSLHELTLTSGQWPCLWKKTIGPPDYVNWIPMGNCSA